MAVFANEMVGLILAVLQIRERFSNLAKGAKKVMLPNPTLLCAAHKILAFRIQNKNHQTRRRASNIIKRPRQSAQLWRSIIDRISLNTEKASFLPEQSGWLKIKGEKHLIHEEMSPCYSFRLLFC